jgi:two-component system CheB/CheR fusion protein
MRAGAAVWNDVGPSYAQIGVERPDRASHPSRLRNIGLRRSALMVHSDAKNTDRLAAAGARAMHDQREIVDEGQGLEELLQFLRDRHGSDFTGYKRPSLTRRIRRRMEAVGANSYASYRMVLDDRSDELDALFNAILVNVTSFFRDSEAWGFLAEHVVPSILREAQRSDQVRIWSAGCASGEEPFSLAMLFAEAMGLDDYCRRAKVYATDWDEDALAGARRAHYPEEAIASMPEALRGKYFTIDNGRAALHGALRRSVIFGRHDLVEDSPISRIDLLVCRNTMMYFDIATQAQILARFHFALKDRGYLFLGRAEMLVAHGHAFAPLDLPHRVFTKAVSGRRPRPAPRSVANAGTQRVPAHTRALDFALAQAPTAQVVLDGANRLLSFNRAAAAMHQLGESDVGKLLQDLEVSYRPADLRSLVDRAREAPGSTTRTSVSRMLPDGTMQMLEVAVDALFEHGSVVATSITFADVTKEHLLQDNLQKFSQNLETAYEELQSANEELETTNEELHSANEELETTNEELQAANEEMETINEELRSTNDELETTNETLRGRETDLARANTFLAAILGSLHAGVAVVDHGGRILVWNDRAAELWGVRADEVTDTPLASLDIGLPVGELTAPIADALRTGESQETTLAAVNRRGRAIRCHVTINPMIASEPRALTLLMDIVPDGEPS